MTAEAETLEYPTICEYPNSHDTSNDQDLFLPYYQLFDETLICDECYNAMIQKEADGFANAILRGCAVYQAFNARKDSGRPFPPYSFEMVYDDGLTAHDRVSSYGASSFRIKWETDITCTMGEYKTDHLIDWTIDCVATLSLQRHTTVNQEEDDTATYAFTFDKEFQLDTSADEHPKSPDLTKFEEFIKTITKSWTEKIFCGIGNQLTYEDALELHNQHAMDCPCEGEDAEYHYTICGDECDHTSNNPAAGAGSCCQNTTCPQACNCPYHCDGFWKTDVLCSQCGNMIHSEHANCYYLIGNDIYCIRCAYDFLYKYGVEHHCFDGDSKKYLICPCYNDAQIEKWIDRMISTGLFPEIRKIIFPKNKNGVPPHCYIGSKYPYRHYPV